MMVDLIGKCFYWGFTLYSEERTSHANSWYITPSENYVCSETKHYDPHYSGDGHPDCREMRKPVSSRVDISSEKATP